MKLKNLRIQNYKCILDSTEFSISDVTCLVGKNESGKSAILQALYKLNPIEKDKTSFNYLDEYPRNELSEYEQIKDKNPANVLTTKWELDDVEVEILKEKFGVFPLQSKTFTVSKGYDNTKYYSISVDEKKILEYYLKQLSADDKNVMEVSKINDISELRAQLENIKELSDTQKSVLNLLKETFKDSDSSKNIISQLSALMPKFVYFPDYEKMAGKIAINTLNSKVQSNQLSFAEKIFIALLDLAGTTYQEIQSLGTLEHLIARLEGISNRLTKEIFKYWSQNTNLKVIFRFDNARPQDPAPFNNGYIFLTRIENLRHGVTVSFDERSSGFIWFFSFLVWFSQAKKNYGDKLFLLLDEPGLNLHAKAQADLLKYFREKLKPFFQILYTTHSPFMIDSENLFEARTVEDVFVKDEVLGTKVGDKVLSTDSDTLFPLQAALGYEITQTLFVGKHTLLVEGPSDLLYLHWFSNQLKEAKRTYLDPKWIISPSGGIDKISSFVTLFGGNKLHIAVLSDYHDGDKKKVKNLRESELLKSGHIFTADVFAEQDEADIEDIIGRANYIALINECYGLTDKNKLQDKKSTKSPMRVVQEVEDHFRLLTDGTPMFDHFTPSLYLTENTKVIKSKMPDLKSALDKFEKLFSELNNLLSD